MAKTNYIIRMDAALECPDAEWVARTKEKVRQWAAGSGELLVLSPGCDLFAVSEDTTGHVTISGTGTPAETCYSVRERVGDHECEVTFATHGELVDYLAGLDPNCADTADVQEGVLTQEEMLTRCDAAPPTNSPRFREFI